MASQKSPKERTDKRKQQGMLNNFQVTLYPTAGIIFKKLEKTLGSWQGESFLLTNNSSSSLQTNHFCQLLDRKGRSDFKINIRR